MMRSIDNSDINKHLQAMGRITPLCRCKLVRGAYPTQYMRIILLWRGYKIRCGLVIGELDNGEPMLTETGMVCLEQWMAAYPGQKIVFVEFKHISTGNTKRLRRRLKRNLYKMQYHDNAVLLLVAKNPTMYDKLGALIGMQTKMNITESYNAEAQLPTEARQRFGRSTAAIR